MKEDIMKVAIVLLLLAGVSGLWIAGSIPVSPLVPTGMSIEGKDGKVYSSEDRNLLFMFSGGALFTGIILAGLDSIASRKP